MIMAVVTIPSPEIMKLTGLKKEQVLEGLNDIGMPTEESEGEMFVEVTPNRPDLFSIEGIARALNSFYGKAPGEYAAKKSDYAVKIDPSVGASRPFFVGAVVKGVKMDESALKSLIQLQEKLHETVGRKRKKVAIGIHNADAIAFPLVYKFSKEEKFIPLDFEREMGIKEIVEKHPKGRAYAHLVKDGYPMLCDQKGVISFPPIINSERTRVSEGTKNLVIDITGTHQKTLSGVLNILVCALADRGGQVYEMVVGKDAYPKLEPQKMPADTEGINKLLGEKYTKAQIFANLTRLGWTNDGKNSVFVPPYRMDVSHYADVAEDVAIAHGYNVFKPTVPNFFIPGSLAYNNDDVRQGMIGLGFLEVVNYALTNQKMLDIAWKDTDAVKIINPKTEDFTMLRTNLAVSLLGNVAANKTHELPVKIFEIGRAYEAREKNHLAFAISAEALDFSTIKGVLQSISLVIEKDFELKKSQNVLFVKGRGADVYYKNAKIGVIGEIAPEILESFGIENPVALCEIEIIKG
ncbi:Phenylalanine--tRNA ligase beta subunit [Candidatus Burarchaeum australiense]|nr:Phenylalanine--tRNA ligase beta subunit [Candidatus Burarchaeum australiense]